jgi:hypothetical protein
MNEARNLYSQYMWIIKWEINGTKKPKARQEPRK